MSKLLLPPILLLSAVATATAPKKLGIFDQLSLIGQATGTAGATQTVANAGAGISFRVGGVSALVSLQPSDALILSDRRSSSLWRNLLSPSSSQSSYYLDIRYSPWNDWAATTFLRNLGFRARANVSVVKWKIPDETDKTGAVLLQGPASSDIYNPPVNTSGLLPRHHRPCGDRPRKVRPWAFCRPAICMASHGRRHVVCLGADACK